MVKLLHRYISAQFILPFFVSASFFVTFLLTFQMFKVTTLVINKGASIPLVIELMGHISMTFLPLAIPLSVLFATMYTLNRMSEDSEIVVMRSLGQSRFDLIKPFLFYGVLIGLAIFALNSTLVPSSKKEFRRIITLLTSRTFLSDIKKESFYTEIPGVTIYASEVSENGTELSDVLIEILEKKKKHKQVIMAKSGFLLKKENIDTGSLDMRMNLFDGNIFKDEGEFGTGEKIHFKEYDYPIPVADLKSDFATKNSMISTTELKKLLNLNEKQRKKEKISNKDWHTLKIEYWSRYNTAILCLVFIFLGFGLGIQNARGKRKNTSLVCFVVLVVYYTLFFTGLSFAKKGEFPAFAAVFIPTLLASIYAGRLYRKLEWVS